MLSSIKMFSSAIFSAFQVICYPLQVLIGSILRNLRGRASWRDPEVPGILKSKTGEPVVSNEPNDMSHVEIVEVRRYYPPGVSEIIGRGGESFIGVLDESTVLKYPCIPGDHESIRIEAKILEVLGSHPRIIASRGLTENGLILQRALNGSLNDYITSQPVIPFDRRLRWCKQAAEAVSYIHGKHVIHCDINLRNFLLDENLDLQLADFQGMLKSLENETVLDGLSRECSKSYLPRDDGDFACVKTDIFALGSAIYFIMTGHEIFPELDSLEDDEEISSRFRNGLFPTESHACSTVTEKCWTQQYLSADDVIHDLSLVGAVQGAC